jgi:hypothetical protein
VKLHIGPRLGQMTLSSINPPKLRQWRGSSSTRV